MDDLPGRRLGRPLRLHDRTGGPGQRDAHDLDTGRGHRRCGWQPQRGLGGAFRDHRPDRAEDVRTDRPVAEWPRAHDHGPGHGRMVGDRLGRGLGAGLVRHREERRRRRVYRDRDRPRGSVDVRMARERTLVSLRGPGA